MKKITKKQFLADVRHEIEALKVNATKAELGTLDFKEFDPQFPHQCIYGQISGDCRNERAHLLMDRCCIRQMDAGSGVNRLNGEAFADITDLINGAYDGRTWIAGFGSRNWSYLSALEGYINLKDAKNANIIAYLRGERNDLVI